MAFKYLEQFYQRKWRLGLAVLIARKRIGATAKNLASYALVEIKLLAHTRNKCRIILQFLERNYQNVVDNGEPHIHFIAACRSGMIHVLPNPVISVSCHALVEVGGRGMSLLMSRGAGRLCSWTESAVQKRACIHLEVVAQFHDVSLTELTFTFEYFVPQGTLPKKPAQIRLTHAAKLQ